MKEVVKRSIRMMPGLPECRLAGMVMLTALLIAGCANEPVTQRDPYNDADAQRSRAGQSQDELSRESPPAE